MPKFIIEEKKKLLDQEDSYGELNERLLEVDIRLEEFTQNDDYSFVESETILGKRLFY